MEITIRVENKEEAMVMLKAQNLLTELNDLSMRIRTYKKHESYSKKKESEFLQEVIELNNTFNYEN